MTESRISKKELAARIDLTTRQVTNLVDEGMPRIVEGNRVYFPWPQALHWYLEWKTRRASATEKDDEQKNLRLRQLEAEVRMAELELARAEGRSYDLDYLEAQLTGALQRLRAKMLNIPGKYAPALVGCRTIAEAQLRLEEIVAEAMASLSETGEDPELDQDEDDAGGAGGVAS